jgi:hypothetical protein
MSTPYQSARTHQRAGLPADEVTRRLVAEGLDSASARVVVNSVFSNPGSDYPAPSGSAASAVALPRWSPQPEEAERYHPSTSSSGTSSNVIIGLVLIAVGILITIGTLSAAAPGGTYIIAFGPVIAGVRFLIRGNS